MLNKFANRFDKKLDALAAAIVKAGGKICYGTKKVEKCVGPIWGSYEAKRKVTRYMKRNVPSSCKWKGRWWSKHGTSFAEFICKTMKPCH